MTPGPLLEALLAAMVPDERMREAMLGDLSEDATLIEARAGARAARHWYQRQVLASLPPLLRLAVQRTPARSWGLAVLAALGGYVAIMTLVFVLARLVRAAGGPALIGPAASSQAGVALVSVLGAVAGGYVAAWIGRRAPYASAAVLGGLFVLIGLLQLRIGTNPIPLGVYLALELTTIPATLCGAALRALPRSLGGPAP